MCKIIKFLNYWNKETYLAEFFFIYENKREEIRQNDILTHNQIISLSNLSLKSKESFELIFSKTISGGGDFPRTIEIALSFICRFVE